MTVFRCVYLLIPLLALAALSACKEERQSTPDAAGAPVPAETTTATTTEATATAVASDATAPASGPALVINGETVSPFCFFHNMSEDDNATVYHTQNCDMTDLEPNTEAAPPLNADFVSESFFYLDGDDHDHGSAGEAEVFVEPSKYPGFIGYKYLGDYRGMKVVEVVENGGGSGTYTRLQLFRLEKDGTLRLEETLAGGDRCNGGLDKAFIDGSTLVYDVKFTPYSLIVAQDGNPRGLPPYGDIESCAACCYATMRYVNRKPESVILTADTVRRVTATSGNPDSAQACFDKLVGDALQGQDSPAIPYKAFMDLITAFKRTCADSQIP